MEAIIPNERKEVAISHSIVQAARPRSAISPILLRVGISTDHLFGSSKYLEMLSSLGFSISYDEVTRYKQSAVQSKNYAKLGLDVCPKSSPSTYP